MANKGNDVVLNIGAAVDKSFKSSLNSVGTSFTKFSKRISTTMGAYERSSKSLEKYQKSLGDLQSDLSKTNEKLQDYEQTLKDLQSIQNGKWSQGLTYAQSQMYQRKAEDTDFTTAPKIREKRTGIETANTDKSAVIQELAQMGSNTQKAKELKKSIKNYSKVIADIQEQLNADNAALEKATLARDSDTKELAGLDKRTKRAKELKANIEAYNTTIADLQNKIVAGTASLESSTNTKATLEADLKGMDKRGKKAKELEASIKDYDKIIKSLYDDIKELRALENLDTNSDLYAEAHTKAMDRLGTKIDVVTSKIETLQSRSERYNRHIDAVQDNIKSSTQSMENDVASMSETMKTYITNLIISGIGKSTTAFKKFGSSIVKYFGKAIGVLGKTVTYTNLLRKATRTLVQYGFGFRSLYYLVRQWRSALVDGFEYLAQATSSSKAGVAKMAKEVKALITSLREAVVYFKAAGAAMLQPFVPLVTTILPTIVQWFNRLSVAVATFVAQLTGQSYIVKASDNLEDYANALDETASSAKKATQALGAYDKLNVIDKGSSGSGSKTSIDTSDWFTTEQIDENALLTKVRTAWNAIWNMDNYDINAISTMFTELGTMLGDKVTELLESVNTRFTTEIIPLSGRLATAIATMLNGMAQTGVGGEIGTAIANVINTFITFSATLLSTLDWSALGTQLVAAISGFISTIDVTQFGQAIHDLVTGIFTLLSSALAGDESGTLGTQLGTAIGKVLAEVDLANLAGQLLIFAGKLAGAIKDAIVAWAKTDPESFGIVAAFVLLMQTTNLISKLVSSGIFKVFASEFASKIAESLAKSIAEKGIIGTVASAFKGITSSGAFKTFSGIGVILGGLVTAVKNFFDMWENGWNISDGLLTAVGVALVAIGAVILGAPALIAAVVAGIVAVVANLAVVIKDNWSSIKQFFSDICTSIGQFFSDLCSSIGQFFSDVWQSICGVWSTVSGWFDEHIITPLSTFFEGVTLRIGQFFEGCWYIIQGVWIVVSDWFDENVIQPVKEWFESVCESISKFFKDAWDKICEVWGTVSDWFKEHIIDPVKTKFDEVCTSIKEFFADAWSGIKETFSPVAEWFTNLGTKIKEAFETATEAVKTLFEDLWTGIKDSFKSAINNVLDGLESAINWIIDKINFLLGKFNKVAKWGAKLANKNYEGVTEIPKVSIPRLAQGAVIPPNKEFMAVLGDQKQGTNIEAPLETIKQALAETLGSYQPVSTNNQPIVLQLNGKTIAQVVWDENKKRYKQTGKSYAY